VSDLRQSLDLYLESLTEGFGDSDLGVLSKESQFFRKITPRTSFQLFRDAKMYSEAQLDQVFVVEPLAFAFFKPAHPVLPIVFRHEAGLWLVHEPLSWSLSQTRTESWPGFVLHLYWLDRARLEIEKKSFETLSDDELSFAADVYTNLGMFSSFLKIYEILVERYPNQEKLKRNLKFYQDVFSFNDNERVLAR
jgi:hypothetical protein